MKHQYDDKDIQAAIGAACKATASSTYCPSFALLRLIESDTTDWPKEKPARLHLLKTALDHLPEPPPPVVDGKTPGQVCWETWAVIPPVIEHGWNLIQNKEAWEQAASAVLAAFGQHSLATLAQNQVSLTPEQADVVEQVFQSEVFDTHFADIRLPESPKEANASARAEFQAELEAVWNAPETFEAHGKVWRRHTPGDPMPCDAEADVFVMTSKEGPSAVAYKANTYAWHITGGNMWWGTIIGWRYADEPSGKATSEVTITPGWTPAVGDVVRLKSGGPKMTIMSQSLNDDDEPIAGTWLCGWIDGYGSTQTWRKVHATCLQPAKGEQP